MGKKKTILGPPASASPGQKGICHSESCGGTFSDKGLSQGQGQPAEREVEPESPVPGQAVAPKFAKILWLTRCI